MNLQSVNSEELDFFNAVSELMDRSFPSMRERFGLWRIHQHFALAEGEVFHETSNSEIRESTLRIIKKEELPKTAFASTWKLTPQGPLVGTWCCDDIVTHPEK